MVDFHRNTHPTGLGREHIPHQPLWIAIIRVIQGIFNILVLSLAAKASSYYYLNGYGMAFFTFAWTVLFLLYIFLTPHFFPRGYHFWGHVAFEALTMIFWLVTFALLADYVRVWSGIYYFWDGMVAPTRAAMAFALLNWLLFCVTLAATVFLSRKTRPPGASVDGTHSHADSSHVIDPNTTATSGAAGGGFFSSLGGIFGKKNRAADVEKHGAGGIGGPVNETGQPVELNDRVGNTDVEHARYGHNGGYGNGVEGGYQQEQHPNYAPPPASYHPEGPRHQV